MTLRKGFEPHLAVDATTVTLRDVEMLRAIDRFGSMHRASNELGRSYAHLQRRVVELEEAVGSLTTRRIGGEDGGGTELTGEARDLIRQFERLRVELSGVASITESIIRGSIVDRDGELVTVRTDAGEVTARAPEGEGEVEIAIRSDAVVLMRPGSPTQEHTSLRNQLSGRVRRVDQQEAIASVDIDVGEGVELTSVITAESRRSLELSPGDDVIAAFKTTAARATPYYGAEE